VSAAGLAERLREATRPMHRLAERSGIMRAMLRGDVAAPEYCLLLRNLHALYAALERQLDRHADLPALAPVRFPVLFRSTPLMEDLRQLHGPHWPALPLADAMHAYDLFGNAARERALKVLLVASPAEPLRLAARP